MNPILRSLLSLKFLLFVTVIAFSQQANPYPPVEQVAQDFKALLQRPVVNFQPTFQSTKTDSILIEKGFIYAEESEKIPVLIYKPVNSKSKSFPVVICLHGTGGNKEQADIKNYLYKFSKLGIMAVSIDARYHGERVSGGADGAKQYNEAIIKAWQNTGQKLEKHPFYFDTVYDLWRLTDYLITRPDVQKDRIGMMGISMGGIQTWMAASVDTRIKVAAPDIAIQSFKWSLENNMWQGRANTIRAAHQQAAKDLGHTDINEENVKAFWDKLIPGITDKFDCPSMIRLFAPRPLLLMNNEKDANCPLPGAQIAFDAATNEYRSKNALDKLKIHITPNETHRLLPAHIDMTINWFVKWL